MIFAAFCLVLVFFLPETYGPVLLMRRARELRRLEPEKYAHIYAPLERADNSWRSLVERTLLRPLKVVDRPQYAADVPDALRGADPAADHHLPRDSLRTALRPAVVAPDHLLGRSRPIDRRRGTELLGCVRARLTSLMIAAIAIGATGAMFVNILLFRRYVWLYPKWRGNVPPEERLCVYMTTGASMTLQIRRDDRRTDPDHQYLLARLDGRLRVGLVGLADAQLIGVGPGHVLRVP